jgi:TRAP-type mannitol/chloroaromatic compound transport system substrate-binding protein
MVNAKALAALPSDLQAIVAYACQAANEDMLNEFTARNNGALQILVKKHGVQLRRFSDELLTEVGKTAADVVAEIAGKDPFSNKVYTSFDAFRSASVSYTRISEEAYTQARALTFG